MRRAAFVGVGMGIGLMVVAAVTEALIVGAVFRWWPEFLPHSANGDLDQVGTVAAIVAFTQAYTGLFAIVIAGALGYLAIDEFRHAQERPQLRLRYVGTDSPHLALATSANSHDTFGFQLELANEGPVVTNWFMLEVAMTFTSSEVTAPELIRVAVPVVGQFEKHWVISRYPDGSWLYTFMSNGEIAVYPDHPLILLQFAVPSAWFGRSRYELPWNVAADRAKRGYGTLYIDADVRRPAVPVTA